MKTICLVGIMLSMTPFVCGAEEGQRREGPTRQGWRGDRGDRGEREHFEKHGRPEGGLPRLLERPEAWERLGLSEAEATALRKTLAGLEEQERILMEKSRDLAREQADLLHQAHPSKEEVFARIEEIGRLRTEMAKLRMARLFAIRDVLGEERMTQLRGQMEKRTHRRGRPQEREREPFAPE